MHKLDNQNRLLIPRDLLNLVKITPPCDLLLIRKEDESNCFYLVAIDSPFRFNKQILGKLHIDEKGRIRFKAFFKNILFKNLNPINFEIYVIISKEGNNWIEIKLIP